MKDKVASLIVSICAFFVATSFFSFIMGTMLAIAKTVWWIIFIWKW